MNSYENKNLKFDTVKIRTKKEYFKEPIVSFTPNINPNGECTGMYYNSKKDKSIPYNLFIGINNNSQSLTLEFSSKVLLDDYPKLITRATLRQCLENINRLGICTIDVNNIINDCYFDKIHITRDIDYHLTNDVFTSLNSCVGNYRRYKWEHYEGEGIRYSKDVKSKECKETIVIYDKEKEIQSSKNKQFFDLLDNPDAVIGYFSGKTRFEMELDSPNKICKFLNIGSTHINYIFGSDVNPLLVQFNKVFGKGEIENKYSITNYEDYSMQAIIEKHNGDLKKIEQEMKDLHVYSSNSRTGLSKRMKKIRQLHSEMYNKTHGSINILAEIRGKLSSKLPYFTHS
ncbi:hypothetical protein [Dysgonomonas gadei]|uniref:Replication-associated protein G2P N-terminal domain-containing protein n=1 Tax=Dysgonomonas gadei ATCC BAA-286 TaxID=742766 RepID=F5J2N9_9BACT|nr:hypothetical protein [Dysgonomonas gadei]EGK00082.1 hypothetical protein HMPREF9455_03606 [Dysgonomonas gadei ATCC BAA-286]